jgi:peptidoglycan/xylan/chitin deacetylase (PgdA/CDA1 family)
VRATFFIDGLWASKHPDELKAIYRGGHEIGNHAFSHPNMSRLSSTEMEEEIAKTDKVIRDTLDIKPNLFAPPSGDFNDLTVRTAAKLGYRTILWTIDTVDWRHPAPALVVEKIGNGIGNGFLVLMHPTDSSVGALPGMISRIREKQIELGTVSEVLNPHRFPPVEVERFF